MQESNETFIEIKLTNDKNLLYYNESGVFKVGNGNFLNNKIVDENTKLETLTYIYSCLHKKIKTREYEETELEVIFKFFELANDWIKKIYNNKKTDNETKKNIEKLLFLHRVDYNSYSFEAKDISGKYVDDIFILEEDNWFHPFHKNTYPRCFSLCGGLNFDYDYYQKKEEFNDLDCDMYFKKNKDDLEEVKKLKEVKTRNNNGWIVKDGWVDRVCNSCCNCNNNETSLG